MFQWQNLNAELKKYLSQGTLTTEQLQEIVSSLTEAHRVQEKSLLKPTILNSLYLMIMIGIIGVFLMEENTGSANFGMIAVSVLVLMFTPFLAFPLMKRLTRYLMIERVKKQFNTALAKGYSAEVTEHFKLQ